ncbi:UvrD-helicase domain-containing protein [Halosquirtibacter xylanolyticus]|uniref:3'-5' exonuclease n=1 Tax=Halosquirtibacter xylanolyticus TaxID=3374599 RepID=UPI003747B796|nr:UvrD-helicase domain-containing protein [Prolixibacteraceae bacterium]
MKKITLSKEQETLAQFPLEGPYAIKGVAGSGKTTVGLHRIHFLKEKCGPKDKILVVTFHKVLTDYLTYLQNKEATYNQKKTGNYNLFQNNTGEIDIINIDKLVYRYYKQFKDSKNDHKYYKNLPAHLSSYDRINQIFQKSLCEIQNKYPDCKVLFKNSRFLQQEINFINSCRIENEKTYQIFNRKGRNKNEIKRQLLPKKSLVRKAIFELRRTYNNNLILEGEIDFHIMRLLAIREVSTNPPRKYKHIIIDECQDLDRARLDFLKFFLKDDKGASATFLYDNSQSIYDGSWLGNGHGFNSLGIDIVGNRSRILKHNYRTTLEIQEAAQTLIHHNNFYQEVEPILINKGGIKPFLAECKDIEQHNQYIIDTVKNAEQNFNLNDIIVATRTNQDAKQLEKQLKQAGIKCALFNSNQNDFESNSVRVMTINCTKGLESQMVILTHLNQDIIPVSSIDSQKREQDLRLLYVGMTRASQILHLVSYGESTEFIKDIPKEPFKIVDLESYQAFKPLEAAQKKKIFCLIDQLSHELKNFEHIKNTFQPEQQYEVCFSNLMLGIGRMQNIQEKAQIIKNELKGNSSISDHITSFIETCESKRQQAQDQFIQFSICPFPIENRVEILKKRHNYFSDETIQTVATAEHFYDKNTNSFLDFSTMIISYSKAIEIELHHIFENYDYFSLDFFKDKLQYGTQTYKLYDILYFMKDMQGPLKEVNEMLEYVNFRRIRNLATHAHCINHDDIEPIREILIQEEGVFDILNQQLEEI